MLDTLKLKNRLSESGMPEAQAQVLVEELDGGLDAAVGRLANKEDLTAVRNEITAVNVRLGSLEAQVATIRWMVGFVGAGVLAILVRSFLTP